MRLSLTESDKALQAEVRAFLETNAPSPDAVPHDLDDRFGFLRNWQSLCYLAGYVGRAWPAEFGGGGSSAHEQIIVDQEFAAFGAPEYPAIVGLDVIGPSLLRFGTDEQRRKFIPDILSGQSIWCQGFSEPESGSDLASLRTVAEEDGDHFAINGQKTWTSWAQFSDWCAVLAITEKGLGHKGISMLIVEMHAPGVQVRPMTQITGHAEFSEVFFDNVRVHRSRLLGERGQGWAIALHTLSHERGTAALPRQVKLRTLFNRLLDDVRSGQAPGVDLDEAGRTLAQTLVSIEVLKHHAYRTVGQMLSGQPVGPESSSVKLLMADAEQRLGVAAMDMFAGPVAARGEADHARDWWEMYLYSRAASVYGGTQQIQRNILAQRVLKLPG